MSNESVECPLCMEPMDFDDVDFYPCPCRYQICRFCWDKILNEENGLCPACRKAYNSENPASYKPRTEEEIKNKIKHSKKVCTKKTKPTTEGKEYLSEYRVLQKNLIFVVGLPMRMAEEVELLKGLEYFGKCGKVYKIVINQNQTFPGPQGTPCLSAYVTYHRNEDALKTLVDLKKLEIDGRAVKLSLGTTKYCSQFLRNRRCTKQDCMYLHEMGDHAASFTKEDMANGKHTEYENQLIQEFYENQKVVTVSPSTVVVVSELDKPSTQRKSSLTSLTTSCVTCIVTSVSSTSSVYNKPQRSGYTCQITPIGTDPTDATKIYSISSDNSISKSSSVIKNDPSSSKFRQSPPQDSSAINHVITAMSPNLIGDSLTVSSPLSSDLPFMMQAHNNNNNNSDNIVSHSLLDSFYYLKSQATNDPGSNQPSFVDNISQQVNNNGLSNYSQFPDFSRSFGSDKGNTVEQRFKDTADIDFDPIDISRLALAELVATESRQKMNSSNMNSYSNQIYAPPPQRNMLRPSQHEYMMQSNAGDFYNISQRVSTQQYMHEKQQQQQQSSSNDSRIQQQMSVVNLMAINNNLSSNPSVSVVPISSGYPSPPPGFEASHSNSCIGEPPGGEMMNIMINHGNVDMYNRYQNQHSTSEMSMGINQHSSHYSNQYSILPGNSYHNDFSGFSNGGYSDPITPQSHPWKNSVQQQPLFGGDGLQDASHVGGISRSVAYNRSQSMNENTGIRNTEWNGFASYNNSNNNTNDSHMSNYPFY